MNIELTQEQKRIRIAEACGFNTLVFGHGLQGVVHFVEAAEVVGK